MKNILIILGLTFSVHFLNAQNTFKTAFTNSENNTIELSVDADELIVEGGSGSEIIIESIGEKISDYKKPVSEDSNQPVPDRAKGLKPLSAPVSDNTGLGIMVEKHEGMAKIQSNMNVSSNKFKITVPAKVKLIINEFMPARHPKSNSGSDYTISKMENEVIITSMNSSFKLSDMSGSLVLNTTNGNVEAVYSAIKTTKPISIVTINGFVDLTLPSTTKADLELQTMNGKAYTDFDIKSDEDKSPMHIQNVEFFHVAGKVNGGGGIKVNINSINGNIYLRKK